MLNPGLAQLLGIVSLGSVVGTSLTWLYNAGTISGTGAAFGLP